MHFTQVVFTASTPGRQDAKSQRKPGGPVDDSLIVFPLAPLRLRVFALRLCKAQKGFASEFICGNLRLIAGFISTGVK
jgi:hypothetical protein